MITPVLHHTADVYKGLVVLRLDGNDRPGIVFWQDDAAGPGMVRLVRPRQGAFALEQTALAVTPPGMVLEWSLFDGYQYTVQHGEGTPGAPWQNADGSWPINERSWTNSLPEESSTRLYRVLASPLP